MPQKCCFAARRQVRHHLRRDLCRAWLPLPGLGRADARSDETGRPPRHALPGQGRRVEPCRHAAGDRRCRARGGDITNERTGIIMGSGGPSTRTIVEAADITREQGPQAHRAVRRAQGDVVDRIGDARHLVQDQGRQLFDLVGLRDLGHCIGNAYELIQWGKQDMMFAGGHEDLDWTLSNLFDAMGAMSSKYQRHAAPAPRAPMTSNRDGFVIAGGAASWCSKNWNTPRRAARRSTPSSSAMARPPTATTWSPRRAKARCAACAWRWTVKAPVDYINPHGTSTPVGDAKEIEAIREVFGDKTCRRSQRHQVADRPFARRHRRAGSDLLAPDDARTASSAKAPYRDPRSGLRRHADRAQAHRQRQDRHALSNSFGFGGTNATLVFQRVRVM
jgi:3-oxoacyl-[acyl-carrier-protein] synthase-1